MLENFPAICMNEFGTRAIQKIIDLSNEKQNEILGWLSRSLKGHVVTLAQVLHSNRRARMVTMSYRE